MREGAAAFRGITRSRPRGGWMIGVAALALLAVPAARAQPAFWSDWAREIDPSERVCLHPLIQKMLNKDLPGTVRNWRSSSGKKGVVSLDSGGATVGSAQGAVTIYQRHDGRLDPLIRFQYSLAPDGEWKLVG